MQLDKNKIIFIICLALGVLGISLYVGLPAKQSEPVKVVAVEQSRSETSETAARSSTSSPTSVKVQISGAVVHPGVYEVDKGTRAEELIFQAGGFLPTADTDKVNRAKVLRDGAHIKVPYLKEARGVSTRGGSDSADTVHKSTASKNKKLLNINTATQEDLEKLPGIGPTLAQRIVDYRAQHGEIRDKQELLKVKGIGHNILNQISSKITLE